ncbi:MAG: thioesterase domain-containing protein, partial [Pseudomonadota bacterium]
MKSRWFVIPNVRPQARLRLFCFPYAAGNASTYLGWIEYLPEDVELVVVQPPGRANRIAETPINTMPDMVKQVADEMEALLDKPYCLFGHSLGSRVAFEVMLLARSKGWPMPRHYIASGSSAPHVCREHKHVSHLTDEEFIEGLMRFDGPIEKIISNQELVELFLPLLRADFNIADTYSKQPGVPLNVPFTVLGGCNDEDAMPHELPSWNQHFSREGQIVLFEGNHFFIESAQSEVA